MKAIYEKPAKPGFNPNHRIEKPCLFQSWQVIVPDADAWNPYGARVAIDLRIYFRGESCLACVWIHYNGFHAEGSAKVGGWGYHRQSAALESALNNAGFTLDKPIHGAGERAMMEALEAVADDIGAPADNRILARAFQ